MTSLTLGNICHRASKLADADSKTVADAQGKLLCKLASLMFLYLGRAAYEERLAELERTTTP
jgi:hypothetical protein